MNEMPMNLFADAELSQAGCEALCAGAMVLRGFALPDETAIFNALNAITIAAPLRRMVTPGGFRMSVAMTNCGSCGWVSDHTGYRYDAINPDSGQPWPAMPDTFLQLARHAAAGAGYDGFTPDACLINCYEPGARLSLHQDKNESDFDAPIVSVSLGLPVTFLWGGLRRADRSIRVPLLHGDVVVWGGPARLRYHGVLPVKPGYHALTGSCRINLTFRKAI